MKRHKEQRQNSSLFLPLASLITGIYAYSFVPMHLWLCSLLLALSIIAMLAVWHKKHPLKALGIIALFFLLGMCRSVYLKQCRSITTQNLLRQQTSLIATVQDIQRLQSRNMRYAITLALTQPVQATISCYTKENLYLEIADTIKLTNIVFKQPGSAHLANNPTYKHYLEKQGISAAIFINDPKKIMLLSRPKNSLWRWIHKLRSKIYWRLKSKLSFRTFSYLSIMFLGNKQIQNQLQLRNSFNQWGLAHFLARSGLHIVLFIFLLAYCLRVVPLHLHIKYLIIFSICCIYYLLSWSSLSFIRAFLLYALIQQGRLWSLRPKASHLLNVISIMILLINPISVFFLDFQFTFGITLLLFFI